MLVLIAFLPCGPTRCNDAHCNVNVRTRTLLASGEKDSRKWPELVDGCLRVNELRRGEKKVPSNSVLYSYAISRVIDTYLVLRNLF